MPGDLPAEAYAMSPDGVVDALQSAREELDEASRAFRADFETQVEVGTAWQHLRRSKVTRLIVSARSRPWIASRHHRRKVVNHATLGTRRALARAPRTKVASGHALSLDC